MRYYNVGVDDTEFRNFAGIYSDKIFDVFYQFAKSNMKKRMPLLIAGGCGLKLRLEYQVEGDEPFYRDVRSALWLMIRGRRSGQRSTPSFILLGIQRSIGMSILGLSFITTGSFDKAPYDVCDTDYEMVADMLANDLIFGWVNGKYEIARER